MKQNEQELIDLAKKLQDFYEMGYVNKKSALWFSFLKGIAGGLGAFIGGTIVIALLLWSLHFFDEIPFVGPIIKTVQKSLHTQ